MANVAVFGAGVAGLTAAHELACRGHAVTVYEDRVQIGGKCRTQYWGVKRYAGEHGFRFFPDFYRNVRETMSRIPLDATTASTAGSRAPYASAVWPTNMVGIDRTGIARDGQPIAEMPRSRLTDLGDVNALITLFLRDMSFDFQDSLAIAWKLAAYYLLGDDRRLEYDRISLWDYLGADGLSAGTQEMLRKLPKSLVAMSATEGNTRTFLNVLFLMMRSYAKTGPSEWILNAPTSESWLELWVVWLKKLGVVFNTGRLTALTFDPVTRKITGAAVSGHGTLTPDCYVVAVPLEAAVPLVTSTMAANCAELRKLFPNGAYPAWLEPATALRWMVGAQLYLTNDVPVVAGHIAFADAPWAVTGISQAQFYGPAGHYLGKWGRGDFAGALSVIASDWFGGMGRVNNKVARLCSEKEIFDELLDQVGRALDAGRSQLIVPANVADKHLDDDINWSPGRTSIIANRSRLLIHPPHQWSVRPTARTQVANLFLAGDYVRSQIDLATMEGANETGKLAAAAALDFVGHTAGDRPAVISHLDAEEPGWLQASKAVDDALFALGLPPIVPVPPPGGVFQVPIMNRVEESLVRVQTRLREVAHTLDPAHPPGPELFESFRLHPLVEGHRLPIESATLRFEDPVEG